MKKFISVFIVLVLAISLCPAVFATENITVNPQSLYEQYEQIIDEANETYECSLSLLPFEEIKDFCSAEEFKAEVINYCENRDNPFETSPGTVTGNVSGRGSGVVTVPCVKTKNIGQATLTATFYGTFDVRMKANGTYYIYSKSFSVRTRSSNGNIGFEIDGNPSVSTVDGGRTIRVTQQFRVLVQGYFSENTSVTATYIMNFGNGNITASN